MIYRRLYAIERRYRDKSTHKDFAELINKFGFNYKKNLMKNIETSTAEIEEFLNRKNN